MLHKEAVDKSTLDVLNRLQSKEYLKGFHLVGGTSIALRIGHRISVDIDLFSNFSFDVAYLLENLTADFNFSLNFSASNTIKGTIDHIQIDILAHRYPLLDKPLTFEHISMLSLPDIIAMKLNVIATSGQRAKDFIDIYYLLGNYKISEMIGFYKKKYKQYNEVNVLKSLVYFDDVDLTDWPQIIDNPFLKWEQVKQKLTSATTDYISG